MAMCAALYLVRLRISENALLSQNKLFGFQKQFSANDKYELTWYSVLLSEQFDETSDLLNFVCFTSEPPSGETER
jgi:hypothetical protein